MTRLMALRVAKKATIVDVSQEVGADRTAVYKWEQGLSEPREEFRVAYAKALGISIRELGAIVYAESVK